MAKFIEIKGSARSLVAAGVLVLLAISIFFPSLLSQVTGSGGRGFSFLRLGYVQQQKTILVGHWIGTAKGSYATGFILAFEGERDGKLVIKVPSTCLYDLQLSYFAFAGSVAFDWTVE